MTPDRYDYTRLPACGKDFEQYVGSVFADLGYGVDVTQLSGDYGADVILTEPDSGRRIAVQAKFYSHRLGNSPIQEVVGSLAHYGAREGWVVTNGTFSSAARTLAEENGVRLIDGLELNELVAAAIDNRKRAEATGGGGVPWKRLEFDGLEVMPEGPVPGDESRRPELVYEGRPVPRWPSGAGVSGGGQASDIVDGVALGSYDATRAWEPSLPGPVPGESAQESDWRNQILNLSDVAARWRTSPEHVKREIPHGLPLFKQQNGRWEIRAGDLADWEERREERAIRQAELNAQSAYARRRSRTMASLVSALISIAVVLALIAVVLWLIPDLPSQVMDVIRRMASLAKEAIRELGLGGAIG